MIAWTMRVTERCSRHTSAWGCLDDADKLSHDICTRRDTSQQVMFNELLHARAFASAGAGGRPWPMSPSAASGLLDRGRAAVSSLVLLSLPKRMTEFTFSFETTSLVPTNGGESGLFV